MKGTKYRDYLSKKSFNKIAKVINRFTSPISKKIRLYILFKKQSAKWNY